MPSSDRLRFRSFLKSGPLLLLTGITALTVFTILPISYGAMVRWPWVLLWQIGFLLIGLGSLGRIRQFQHSLYGLGWHLDWAIGLGLLSITLSTLFAYQPATSVWYFTMVVCYITTLYAVVNELRGPFEDPEQAAQKRLWLFRGLGSVALCTCGVSLVLWWLARSQLTEPVNPFPLGHHNFVAGYLVLIIPLLLALAWIGRGWERWFWGLGCLFAIAILYTTGSRGGILGILGMLGAGLGVGLFYAIQRHNWRSVWIGGGALLAIGGVLSQNPRAQRLIQALAVGQLDGTSRFRTFTIEAGIRIWQAFPWFGVGPGNIVKVYDVFRPIEAGLEASRVQQLHSTPVHLLAELGTLGGLVYLLWLGLLIHLGWHLAQTLKHPSDLALLYGAGAGLLAYTLTGLTDFQLENIGISLTITLLIATLVSLGQEVHPAPVLQVVRSRRYLSILGFTALLAALRLWIPIDLGMMLARTGTLALQKGDFTRFYENWETATRVAPSDPYYKLILGVQLAQFIQAYGDSPLLRDEPIRVQKPQGRDLSKEKLQAEAARRAQQVTSQEKLAQSARTYLEEALRLAPMDELINRFLGTLLVNRDPQQAIERLRQAAQLTPRKPYTYALLGVAYLNAHQPALAVNSFALEGFINPNFLATDVWFQPNLQALWKQTIQQSIALYQNCLAALAPANPSYQKLEQTWVMLRWWTAAQTETLPSFSLPPSGVQSLSPTAQAVLLLSQNQPDQAMQILQPETTAAATLLKAWINPKIYLPQVKKQQGKVFLGLIETLEKTIAENRQIQSWLLSIHFSTRAVSERIGFFSYRNTNGPDLIELPRSLPVNLLVERLELFPEIFFLPELDRQLIAAQKTLLDLDRPHLQKQG